MTVRRSCHRWLSNPGTFGYGRSVFDKAYNSSPVLTQNIAEAKKLVQRAGATGKTITIGTSSQLLSIAALTGAYQAAAQAIGLKVVLRSVSAQDFIDFFVDPKFRAGVDGFPGVDYGDYADPAALLDQVVLPGELQNLDNFSDPAITAALEQARGTANLDHRAALVAKAEELTAQQLPLDPRRRAGQRTGAAQGPDRRGVVDRLPVLPLGRRPGQGRLSGALAVFGTPAGHVGGQPAGGESFVIFAALYLAPGNPIAALSGGRPLPPGSVHVLELRYHLDESFLAQYWYWLGNALHGNLGISITLQENVSTLIASRIWTTAGLVLYASLIIVAMGIGLGVASGLRRGWSDTSILVVTAVSAAIPAFVAAIVLIILFAVKLRWFPALGNGTGFLGDTRRLTPPAIALATASLAIVARVTRAAVRAEGDREHVQTAVSRGIPARWVIRRHILRNATIPITTVTGITVASLIAVAAVVEVAFSLNGLGSYLVQAAQSKDIAVVQGISLVLVTAFVVVNMVVDMLSAALDPRIAPGSRTR